MYFFKSLSLRISCVGPLQRLLVSFSSLVKLKLKACLRIQSNFGVQSNSGDKEVRSALICISTPAVPHTSLVTSRSCPFTHVCVCLPHGMGICTQPPLFSSSLSTLQPPHPQNKKKKKGTSKSSFCCIERIKAILSTLAASVER